MRRFLAAACIVPAAIITWMLASEASFASQQQPHVIGSLGPKDFASVSTPVDSPDYGGGLIQFLITGREPGQPEAVLYNRPEPTSSAHISASSQQASYAPAFQAQPAQSEPNPVYQRQKVDYLGPEKAGTVVVDTAHKFLYFMLGGGKAIRYGVGVARPGFRWTGVEAISRKSRWPSWTPPKQMRLRIPSLPERMAGGPDNPLGARALYLGSTLYRIHGTNEPNTIGKRMSSGCIRMMNDDVKDLYRRVKVGTKVVVI